MKQLIMAYQGEMSLKGLNRRVFESALLKALRSRLHGLGQWDIKSMQSTLYIQPTDETAQASVAEAYQRVGKVFGLANISCAALCEKDMQTIMPLAKTYLDKELQAAATFKVQARRADKTFPLNSIEICRELGGYLLDAYPHLKVDVHTPDLLVTVEVRENAAYVHGGKRRGAGGMPVPSSGRAAVLLSGGIDSPVAAWMMAKRGLGLVAVHFASPPYTSPRASAKVQKLGSILAEWCGPLPYYQVEYTAAQEYLRDTLVKQEYFTVLMRRSMLRIAHVIAQKEQCEAIITGESLAQVASQTLPAIACTNSAQELPVLRPCIGMDKTEITALARTIGSFETSILPFEDCCTIFNPPHPKTKPRIQDILQCEAALPALAQLEEQAAHAAQFTLLRAEE